MANPEFLLRCLDLASLGRKKVGNGALVGAVLVRGEQIIAEGYHAGFGMPHAERALLEAYTGDIQDHDVLYVNLEPCCHTGKTPPCTDIIIERGIKNVVFGMLDPDLRVSGKGVELLGSKGINVSGPFCSTLSERVNRGFASARKNDRPWITKKMATDRTDRIYMNNKVRLKITSAEQDCWSHTFLRHTHDAILVGVGTVIADNPSLSIRFAQELKLSQIEGLNRYSEITKNTIQPYRIIIDPQCRVPMDAKVVSDEDRSRTILCIDQNSAEHSPQNITELQSRGVKVWELPSKDGSLLTETLWKKLLTPEGDFHGITSILVEGGEVTWSHFEKQGLIDEEVHLKGSL